MKYLIASLLAVVVLVGTSASFVRAEPLIDSRTQLQATPPEGWTVETKDDTLTVTSPDSLATVVMMTLDSGDIDAALAGLGEELAKIVTDLKISDETKEHELNGLPAISASGTAKLEGTPVDLAVAVVDAGDHCLLVFALGTTEGLQAHSDAVNAMFASIQKND